MPHNLFTTLHTLMMMHVATVWEQVLLSAETRLEKYFIKIPLQEKFPRPVVPGTKTLDRKTIDLEANEVMKMLKIEVPTTEQFNDVRTRVMSAYL